MSNAHKRPILGDGHIDQSGPSRGYQLRVRESLRPPQRLRSSLMSYSPVDMRNVPCVDYDRTGLFQPFGSNLCCPGDLTRTSIGLGPHRRNQGEVPNSTIIQVDEPSPIGSSSDHYSHNLQIPPILGPKIGYWRPPPAGNRGRKRWNTAGAMERRF